MTDAAAEFERVSEKYAPARRSDILMYLMGTLALGIASLFRQVDWYVWLGVATAAVTWEFTKLRLRRNARDFAEASSSRPGSF